MFLSRIEISSHLRYKGHLVSHFAAHQIAGGGLSASGSAGETDAVTTPVAVSAMRHDERETRRDETREERREKREEEESGRVPSQSSLDFF